MLLIFAPSTQFDCGGYECGEGEPHPFSAQIKVFPRRLEKLPKNKDGGWITNR